MIQGDDTLVMLGFCFGRSPNAEAHVKFLTKRLFARMWFLRHTKAAGIDEEKLVKIYCCYMRPIIEYASNVYNCLLSQELSERIEQLQKNCLRIIYGKKSYGRLLAQAGIQSLKQRRTENFAKFARKIEESDRFRTS